MELLFLPTYSPQLAPIERLWKLARRLAMHNRYFQTLEELIAAVSECFDGRDRTRRCADYAALFKTRCLIALRTAGRTI
jgi:transposase